MKILSVLARPIGAPGGGPGGEPYAPEDLRALEAGGRPLRLQHWAAAPEGPPGLHEGQERLLRGRGTSPKVAGKEQSNREKAGPPGGSEDPTTRLATCEPDSFPRA